MLYDRPLAEALTSAELSEEVIRTLVGSIGLVLAIPVTTLIAVLVVKATGMKRLAAAGTAVSPDDLDDTGALAAAAVVAGSEKDERNDAGTRPGAGDGPVRPGSRRAQREAERRGSD
jgi:hypothetical protein